MYPEMIGEFNKDDERYKAKRIIKMNDYENDNLWEYEMELEYPWGDYKIEYGYDLKNKKIEDLDLKEIDPKELKDFLVER